MQNKQQQQFKVQFQFHLCLELAEVHHYKNQDCHRDYKSSILSDKSSEGRGGIAEMNFPLVIESVRITKDHWDCRSASGSLHNSFPIVGGGLSHIRQRADEERKNNSSNTSEKNHCKTTYLGRKRENTDKNPYGVATETARVYLPQLFIEIT